jgi:hypothetical protein
MCLVSQKLLFVFVANVTGQLVEGFCEIVEGDGRIVFSCVPAMQIKLSFARNNFLVSIRLIPEAFKVY